MAFPQPYPHIYRPGASEAYDALRRTPTMRHFIASYSLLKQDLMRIFEFVEPEEKNLGTHSHRIFEVLLRACMEVESLCKLIFTENGVELDRREENMIRYSDLEGAMRLSEISVACSRLRLPFFPFEAFRHTERSQRSPDWYRSYNKAKHHRAQHFSSASLLAAIQAVGGVYALLVAQIGPLLDEFLALNPTGPGFLVVPSLFSTEKTPEWSAEEIYDSTAESSDNSQFQGHPLPRRP